MVASAGAYLLLRSYGTRPISGALGALIFSYGSFMAYEFVHIPYVNTAVWFPWQLLFLERLLRRRRPLDALRWRSSPPPASWAARRGSSSSASSRCRSSSAPGCVRLLLGRRRGELPRVLLLLFLAVALVVGLTLVLLVPAAEFIGHTPRAGGLESPENFHRFSTLPAGAEDAGLSLGAPAIRCTLPAGLPQPLPLRSVSRIWRGAAGAVQPALAPLRPTGAGDAGGGRLQRAGRDGHLHRAAALADAARDALRLVPLASRLPADELPGALHRRGHRLRRALARAGLAPAPLRSAGRPLPAGCGDLRAVAIDPGRGAADRRRGRAGAAAAPPAGFVACRQRAAVVGESRATARRPGSRGAAAGRRRPVRLHPRAAHLPAPRRRCAWTTPARRWTGSSATHRRRAGRLLRAWRRHLLLRQGVRLLKLPAACRRGGAARDAAPAQP